MPFQWSTFWLALGSLFTGLVAIFTGTAVFAVFVAVKQLRFDAWLQAQQIWTNRDFTERREQVFSRLCDLDQSWDEAETDNALEVCRRLDEFARLIPYLPKHTALEIWGLPFAKAWLVLEPVVADERTKCAWPTKWDAFAHLGKLALDKHPEVLRRAT